MASRRRDWNRLGENQRKRYLAAGRKRGLSEAEVREHYESGGDLSAWRGQSRSKSAGVSERQWRRLVNAAKASKLENRNEVLSSLLAKGFSVEWILDKLHEQDESRTIYRAAAGQRRAGNKQAGIQPGNRRFHGRNQVADIELFYYH